MSTTGAEQRWKTHVSSTLILLGLPLPSSNLEWWNFWRHVAIRSYPSNSKKANPFDRDGSSLCVRCRIEVGFTAEKCAWMVCAVAL